MIKTIHTTDSNEYSEQIKAIWEELKWYPAKDLQSLSVRLLLPLSLCNVQETTTYSVSS